MANAPSVRTSWFFASVTYVMLPSTSNAMRCVAALPLTYNCWYAAEILASIASYKHVKDVNPYGQNVQHQLQIINKRCTYMYAAVECLCAHCTLI